MLLILRCHVLFMESVAACETSHVIKPVYRPWRHHRFKFFLWHHPAPPLDLGLPTPVCYASYQSLVTALLQIKCLCGDFQVQETWCSPLVHRFGSQASCCAASSASSCSLQVTVLRGTNRILFLGCRLGCLLFVPPPPKPMLCHSLLLMFCPVSSWYWAFIVQSLSPSTPQSQLKGSLGSWCVQIYT